MPRFKNIIFDWSGTLSDDLSIVYQACMCVFQEYGLPHISINEYRRDFELPYMRFYEKYSSDISRSRAEEIFRGALLGLGDPTIYPGALQVIQKLFQNGLNMVVLSSVPHGELLRQASLYGITGYFGEFKSAYNKVEEIHDLIKRNNFSPNETLYVGDMTHDVDAGKHGGVTTVALSWGYQPKEMLLSAGPHYLLENLGELESLIFNT